MDMRPDEHKSYINEETSEIFLRSDGFTLDKKSGLISQSKEWIVSDGTITINEVKQSLKTVPISQLSGVELKKAPEKSNMMGIGYLHLYIAGGRSSQTFWGTGGISGLPNYSISFSAHDADIARAAHDYIAAQIAQ